MFKSIFDAVSLKLNQVFGDGFSIYGDEDIKQGLKEPCFILSYLKPSQEQIVGVRYRITFPMDILYFPVTSGSYIEMLEVGGKLAKELEVISTTDSDLIRGYDIHFETVDEVLHFFVTYKMIVRITETPTDNMETLTTTERIISNG